MKIYRDHIKITKIFFRDLQINIKKFIYKFTFESKDKFISLIIYKK